MKSLWSDAEAKAFVERYAERGVAENLALGRPWYAGFVRLMIGLDSNGNPLRNKLVLVDHGPDD